MAANTAITPTAISCRMPNSSVQATPKKCSVCWYQSASKRWMSETKIATAAP